MLNFNSVLLSTDNLDRLVDFYKKVFQKEPDMVDKGYAGFLVGSAFLSIGEHDKVKGENLNPERLLLNFETEDTKSEFERIKGLGAKVIAEPYQMDGMSGYIATFADPDNNYLQLLPPWKPDK